MGVYSFDIIDDIVFALFYDLHKSKIPDIPYWRYKKFDLDKLNDDHCKGIFRFSKTHIYGQIMCYSNVQVDGVEDLCAVLKRFAYQFLSCQ